MKVQFVGVGEAFDEKIPNNSQFLEWDGGRILIDCGYSVPPSVWRLHPDPNYVDAVYLSHRHADHYFGLPSYIVRLAEDGRKRDLNVICSDGMKEVILEMTDYAYFKILPKMPFEVVFHEVTPDEPFHFQNARMEFAPSSHPVKNLSIAVIADDRKYAYSGDGNFTEHTRRLYKDCALLVHEAYSLYEEIHGHAAITAVIEMAREAGVRKLALTHLNRDVRTNQRAEIDELIRKSGLNVILPEVGEVHEV